MVTARSLASSASGAPYWRAGERAWSTLGSSTRISDRNSVNRRVPRPPSSSASLGSVASPVACLLASPRSADVSSPSLIVTRSPLRATPIRHYRQAMP